MKRSVLFVLFMAVVLLTQLAGDVVKVRSVTLTLGKGAEQIGVVKGDGEFWVPLFFAVSGDGLIHIPDFYNGRIAVFDFSGKLVASHVCREGISPRMNYFSLTPSEEYVTFSDHTLYVLSKKGAVVWKRDLGPGFFPVRLYPAQEALFLVPGGADGRALLFSYGENRLMGRFGFLQEGKGIPLIQGFEAGEVFSLDLSPMRDIRKDLPAGAFVSDHEAGFLYAGSKGRSLWNRKGQGSEFFLLFSAEGGVLAQGAVIFPDSKIGGNGFWTFVDGEFNIYKNWIFPEEIEIVMFGFEGRG